jgi:hypothetical protein
MIQCQMHLDTEVIRETCLRDYTVETHTHTRVSLILDPKSGDGCMIVRHEARTFVCRKWQMWDEKLSQGL